MTGIHLIAIIDGEDADGAYLFQQDLIGLMEHNGLTGVVGGDLVVGMPWPRPSSQKGRTGAGCGRCGVRFGGLVTSSRHPALRIAIGTVAVGIAVDGLASHMGAVESTLRPRSFLGWAAASASRMPRRAS